VLAVCCHKTAKARWDTLIKQFRHPGNLNVNTPEGVTPVELDSMPGEDATINPYVPMHLEGSGPEPSMDRKEDHLLKVEEKGIARKNASIEQDIGPCVKLQNPGVSPLATQEDVRLLTPPSSSSPITSKAASMQHPLAVNTGALATPEPDLDNEAKETFCAKMLGVEDEEAFDRARLEGRLVKEDEEWDANEEARLVTMQLVGDAPLIKSMPIPYNVLHMPIHSHTLAAPGAPDEEEVPL